MNSDHQIILFIHARQTKKGQKSIQYNKNRRIYPRHGTTLNRMPAMVLFMLLSCGAVHINMRWYSNNKPCVPFSTVINGDYGDGITYYLVFKLNLDVRFFLTLSTCRIHVFTCHFVLHFNATMYCTAYSVDTIDICLDFHARAHTHTQTLTQQFSFRSNAISKWLRQFYFRFIFQVHVCRLHIFGILDGLLSLFKISLVTIHSKRSIIHNLYQSE